MSTRQMNPAWRKKWELDRHRGHKRLVDAKPVRGHAYDLENRGMSRRSIAEAAGVSATTITNLMNGNTATMQRSVANKVLAVRPEHILARTRPAGFVPAIGARRRIRALYAIGHTADTIAADLGVKPFAIRNIVNHPGRWIARTAHDDIVTAYERLWDVPGPSGHNRARAARWGWLPPMAWDDDTIDDPAATPDTGDAGPNRSGRPAEHVAEDVEFLLQRDPTATADQIAHRLGYADRSGVQNALAPDRGNRPDLLAQLARNAELAGHSGGRRVA